jgi:Dioxygenase
MLGMAIGTGGLTLYGGTPSVFARSTTEPVFTPSIILGPFYPQIKPSEQDPDLTVLAGKQKRAAGEVVYLTGRVSNLKGEPVSGAKISNWQANTHGRLGILCCGPVEAGFLFQSEVSSLWSTLVSTSRQHALCFLCLLWHVLIYGNQKNQHP